MARTTSDFLVASRTVRPGWNAAAISGEYLSAASFLGVAGLIAVQGPDALWYPVGFTAGYLALQLFVAAPLRRSGAYTVPDFAQIRWGSRRLRAVCTGLVLAIAWLYLVPQLHGAGLVLQQVTGLPRWVGIVAVALVVTANVVAGGMRSITLVQAFQYWFKLMALAVPVFVIAIITRPGVQNLFAGQWAESGSGFGGSHPIAEVYSLMLATFLGVMGLPHVLVRFYTTPDGGSARATTVRVTALLGRVLPVPDHRRGADAPADAAAGARRIGGLDAAAMAGGRGGRHGGQPAGRAGRRRCDRRVPGDVIGLVVAAAGVLSTDVLRGRVRDFRLAAVVAGLVPLAMALPTTSLDISQVVGMAFAVAASTFCPLLVLGIWWRGLTTARRRRRADRRRRAQPGSADGVRGSARCFARTAGRAAGSARGGIGAGRVRDHDRRLAADPVRRSPRVRTRCWRRCMCPVRRGGRPHARAADGPPCSTVGPVTGRSLDRADESKPICGAPHDRRAHAPGNTAAPTH